MTPVDIEVIRSNVEITVTFNTKSLFGERQGLMSGDVMGRLFVTCR